MNKKHQCIHCNYDTDRLSSYKDHLKSKKHLKNFANNTETLHRPQETPKNPPLNVSSYDFLTCQFCGKVLSKACHRSRHEKLCIKKQNSSFTEKNKQLLFEKNMYKNSFETLQKQVENLQKYIAEKPQTINNNNNTLINNNNCLQYAENMYPTAPPLAPLPNYAKSVLTKGTCKFAKQKKIEDMNKVEKNEMKQIKDAEKRLGANFNLLCKRDNKDFVHNIISYYRMKSLPLILSNFLIENYVKKDKSTQSLHLTDASRNSFIYAKLKQNLKDIKWYKDPQGSGVQQHIIDPMLYFIGVQIDYHYKELGKMCVNDAKNFTVAQIDEMEHCSDIIKMCRMDSKKEKKYEIRKQIINKIGPFFQLSKNLLK